MHALIESLWRTNRFSRFMLDKFILSTWNHCDLLKNHTILLSVTYFVQLLQTERTYEMFGMKFAEHGCDTSSGNWFAASGAEWATFGMIMCLTVRQSFVIEKWTILERLSTIL